MAFNFLQFAIPHGKGLIKLSDIQWTRLSIGEITLFLPLTLLMLAFTLLNLVLILSYLKSLGQWMADKEEYNNFIGNPSTNIGIFVPIASLSMTANVIWGPLAFFVPQLSSYLQSIMGPALIFFAFLWIMLFKLEFQVLKILLTKPYDVTKMNFVWLLDVFARLLERLLAPKFWGFTFLVITTRILYFPIVNYVSIIFATIICIVVFSKFIKGNKKTKLNVSTKVPRYQNEA